MTKNNDTALLPIPKNREIWTFSEAEKLCAWYSENFETISLVLHNTRPTALIAVAEGMEIRLKEIVRREQEKYDEKRKRAPQATIECSVLIIARDALAAYEAWKGKIEGEGK